MSLHTSLKLPSLLIENYRNIEHLHVPELGRVNLILGKNNVGKTSLLEAVYIYALRADRIILKSILESRNEEHRRDSSFASILESYSSLFYKREKNLPSKIISIGDQNALDTILQINLVPFSVERILDSNDGTTHKLMEVIVENIESVSNNARLGILIKSLNKANLIRLDDISSGFTEVEQQNIVQFIGSDNSCRSRKGRENIKEQWARITLTEKENYIIQALSIIEPIQRVNVLPDDLPRNVVPKIIVQTPTQNRVALKSMGDGMNRIFAIALALVNAENGFLLIDEFDNGLHYSVQENLWKVVYFLAEKLNVQVFATTHSMDCLYAFANVTNMDEHKEQGKAIRLERHNDVLFAETFSGEDLRKVVKHGIEIR